MPIRIHLLRRFTGLLLATKLLPAGDAAAVKAVYDAVGISFINRLLLTLSASQSQVRRCDITHLLW